MINVTKTFLPPLEEYVQLLQRIWEAARLTNNGPLLCELEERLKKYLGVPNIIVTTNGTIPIQIALKLLGKEGEIITTPFSYVATTSSIVWENCKPVFVDIHPEYLTIDESKIEEAISPRTTAILATHVFGNPCQVEEIQRIADKYNLKVIYDGAHSFGVRYLNQSLFNFGDVSTCSFHATKLFHTGEGGAMFTQSEELHRKLFLSHNFGHTSPTHIGEVGINAKTSELQAAMGLAMLPHIDQIIRERKRVVDRYDELLDFTFIRKVEIRPGTEWNYSYYPVIFQNEEQLLKVVSSMNNQGITPRRYFYPSLNTLEYAQGQIMPISESIACRILCLPLYVELKDEEIQLIARITNSVCAPVKLEKENALKG